MTTCPSPASRSGASSTTSSDSGPNARHTTRRTERSVSRVARVARVGAEMSTGRAPGGHCRVSARPRSRLLAWKAAPGEPWTRSGGRRIIPESGRPLHRLPIHRPPRRPNDASATQFANGDPARRPSGTPSRASNRGDRDPEPSRQRQPDATFPQARFSVRPLNLACGNRGIRLQGVAAQFAGADADDARRRRSPTPCRRRSCRCGRR